MSPRPHVTFNRHQKEDRLPEHNGAAGVRVSAETTARSDDSARHSERQRFTRAICSAEAKRVSFGDRTR